MNSNLLIDAVMLTNCRSFTVGIWNPTIWNQETFEVQTFRRLDFKWFGFNWLGFSYGYGPNHLKTRPYEIWTFSNDFWQNDVHLSRFQKVGQSDFRSHLKSGPFPTQPLFDHSKSRLVRISDPHCSQEGILKGCMILPSMYYTVTPNTTT